jgi:hypothetical protein
MSRTLRYYFDTEFLESGAGKPITLVSIGVVCEDGREFYAENADADLSLANEWVKANVLPKLSGPRMSASELAYALDNFVREGKKTPQWWAYYAAYDWVVMCQLFGSMKNLPRHWPQFCMDLQQKKTTEFNRGMVLPKIAEDQAHNALVDARWLKDAYEFLESLKGGTP